MYRVRAGFARVGIGFLAGVLGVVFGFWFYGTPAAWVHKYIHSVTVSNLIGFILVFWAFLLAGALVGKIFSKLFKWTGLSWLDRLMGAGFGVARGVIVCVALITAIVAFAPGKDSGTPPRSVVDSKLAPYMIDAAHTLTKAAPRELRDGFGRRYEQVKRVWEQALKKGIPRRLPETEI